MIRSQLISKHALEPLLLRLQLQALLVGRDDLAQGAPQGLVDAGPGRESDVGLDNLIVGRAAEVELERGARALALPA